MERAVIFSDVHDVSLYFFMPYVNLELKHGSKIIIPGPDNDLGENLPLLEKITEDYPKQTHITAGNHDEGYVKYRPFCVSGMKQFDFYKNVQDIKASPSFPFLEKLVLKAEREYKIKEFTTIKFGGKNIMVLHGGPIDFKDPEGWNGSLWNRLIPLIGYNLELNAFRVVQTLDFLEEKNKRLITGHEHDPMLIIKKDYGFIMYSDIGEIKYEIDMKNKSWKRNQTDLKPIHLRKLPKIKDEIFIFSSGGLYEGIYATAEADDKGIQFEVKNVYTPRSK